MDFSVDVPFIRLLGLELLRFEGGEVELAVPPRADLVNHLGMLHGGVVMTLLDVAMAHAVRSTDADGMAHGPGLVTVEMKTSFLRPAVGDVRALGRVLRKTSSLAFCEGWVHDGAGEVAAHGTGTFKMLKARTAGKAAADPAG
jgi:uncharacterized protein (TIGR00369 family)